MPPTPPPPPTQQPDPFEITDCARTLAEPPAGETCTVTGDPATATSVVLQGDVLGDPDVFVSGEIRFALNQTNATIECVGCDCSEADALVVSCPDAVLSPGLINAHDHIRYAGETVKSHGDERFDHRHDWRRGTRGHDELNTSSSNQPEITLLGELRMMLGGATSIAGSISSVNASGLMRNLDNANYNEGLNPGNVDYSTFPLGDAGFPVLEDSGCGSYNPESSNVLNREIYLPHIAEGIDPEARNEFACLSGEGAQSVDYIQDNTSIVHGIALTAEDIAFAASRGAHLVWSPRSNLSLYGDTAAVVTYDRFGVPIALGTDWVPSGSTTVLRELQCADDFNREHLGAYFSDFDLWRMVTRNGAIAMGVEDQLGRLAVGTVADVAVFANDGRALHHAVVGAGIDDVALVFRGGRPMTGERTTIAGLLDSASFDACDDLSDCLSDHVACLDRFSLAQINAAAPSQAYPVEICEAPADEPSCEPFRDNEDGDGVIYPTSSMMDQDLDGEDDDVDNCPTVFNPRRPLDGWIQPDVDGDGEGDACDVCPLEEGTDCPVGDVDGDGILDLDDNCPRDKNPTQEDADNDGIGAACDPCDDFASPEGACLATVYDVKQGLWTGDLVVVEDLIVTAVRPGTSWFAQLDPTSPTYNGVDYSGIYTFSPDFADQVAVGDVVTITAPVQDFFGQIQLSNLVDVQVVAMGVALPDSTVATPDEVRTQGGRADELEAALVTVQNVEVTALDLPAGPGDSDPSGESELNGLLRVGDFFYDLNPAVGDTFDAVTGVLRFANNASKLEPRGEFDLLFGFNEIDGLTPGDVTVEVGAMATLTVNLRFPAAQVETVQLTCAPAGTIGCPASVDVLAGQSSADFVIDGLANGMATVTASLGTTQAIADVSVYDDTTPRQVIELMPAVLNLQPGNSGILTATIDLPAPAGGLDLVVTGDPGITVPGQVTVPAGDTIVDIDVTSIDVGTFLVTVDGLSATVDVSNAPVGSGIAFWEYFEADSLGNHKFLEIKNLSGADVDLGNCEVQPYTNGNSTPNGGQTFTLSSVMLAPGEVFLVCPANQNPITVTLGGVCDQSVDLSFNGDDAIELLCNGVTEDVIGRIGEDPGSAWSNGGVSTQNSVLRRNCSVTMGDDDGSDAFDPSLEWTATATSNDGSDLGLDHCNP